jgi:hypothetical protein
MRRFKLYLDIDGLVLRSALLRVWNSGWQVAPLASEFLEWAISFHEPVWLTARDKAGTGEGVVSALSGAMGVTDALIDLASKIPVQGWASTKTNAIDFGSDFLWLDDCPSSEDLIALENRGCVQRWIEINTDIKPSDLARAMRVVDGLAPPA